MTEGTLADLKPDPKNARRRTPRSLGMIVDSLHQVGAARSIVVDEDNNILAGNGTIDAAAEAGIERVQFVEADGETIIAVRRSGLTPEQKKKLALFDNRTAELAEWDADVLKSISEELDLKDLWNDDELADLLGNVSAPLLTDPDTIPENVETRCKHGDLWRLDEHRLLCGDCTKAEDVRLVMGGSKAVLCLTDPPYGVNWEYISTDDTKPNLEVLIAGFLPMAREVAAVVLLTPGNRNQYLYPPPDWTLCWFVSAGTGRGPWGFTCWQPVLAYGKCPYLAKGKGSRPDALGMTESAPKVDHACPKPVGVWSWFLERGSLSAKDIVFDPFLGSGTTMIAAEQLGRKCYGIEIEPHYCDVILQRWENATGKTAELIEHGPTPTKD